MIHVQQYDWFVFILLCVRTVRRTYVRFVPYVRTVHTYGAYVRCVRTVRTYGAYVRGVRTVRTYGGYVPSTDLCVRVACTDADP